MSNESNHIVMLMCELYVQNIIKFYILIESNQKYYYSSYSPKPRPIVIRDKCLKQ